jgi:hypothetical protein
MISTNESTQVNGSAQESALNLFDRMKLARTYQKQALERPDPLAANLGVITGDLMGLAHGLGHQVQTQMMQGAAFEDKQRLLFANMDLLLKIVRQVDRLAQIERQLGAPPADKSAAP